MAIYWSKILPVDDMTTWMKQKSHDLARQANALGLAIQMRLSGIGFPMRPYSKGDIVALEQEFSELKPNVDTFVENMKANRRMKQQQEVKYDCEETQQDNEDSEW